MKDIEHLPLHPVAQLLLTAALASRPNTLPHSIDGMALAGAIMASQQRGTASIRLGMLGGLLHDIGEVYIQPSYLDTPGEMDLLGHKHLVVHPRVAQMLLASTTDYPEALCRAIGEHHERMDGSGYPARLKGDNISSLGHVLAVMELILGVMRTPLAPLTRASFALRVIPGEFDPRWTGLICEAARAAQESVPLAAVPAPMQWATQLALIDASLQGTQTLCKSLREQDHSQAEIDLVDTAMTRLARLRVAWNALGSWGLGNVQLAASEAFEMEMGCKELNLRIRNLQRECLLLAERLGPPERTRLEPLWRGLLEPTDLSD